MIPFGARRRKRKNVIRLRQADRGSGCPESAPKANKKRVLRPGSPRARFLFAFAQHVNEIVPKEDGFTWETFFFSKVSSSSRLFPKNVICLRRPE